MASLTDENREAEAPLAEAGIGEAPAEAIPTGAGQGVAAPQQPAKRHRVYDHKILTFFWVIFVFFVLSNVISLVIVFGGQAVGIEFDLNRVGDYVGIATGLVMLLWFHLKFRGEFQGILGWSTEGLRMALPALLFVGINLMGFLETTDINPIVPVLVMALSPGIAEEVIFRAIPCSNWMRVSCDERSILPNVLVSATIFGIVHGANLIAGAALSSTIFQVTYAFALGVFFAAVTLRCGSVWPTIIMHTLIDASGFLFMDMATNGIITDELEYGLDFYLTVAAAIILLLVGLYLIRPSKRGRIVKKWRAKWHKSQARHAQA